MSCRSVLRRAVAVAGVSAVSLAGVTLSAAPAQAASHAALTRTVVHHAHPFGHGPQPGVAHRAHPFGHGPRPGAVRRAHPFGHGPETSYHAHPRMHGMTH